MSHHNLTDLQTLASVSRRWGAGVFFAKKIKATEAFFIWDAWNASLISDIILALVYVGVVGYILDRAVATAGNWVTRGTAAS